MVTLTRVASLPRTLIPVYPTPAPASLVVTTLGKKRNKTGRSFPKFCLFNSSSEVLVNAIGVSSLALRALTVTDDRATVFAVSVSCVVFACCAIRLQPSISVIMYFICVKQIKGYYLRWFLSETNSLAALPAQVQWV